MQIAVIVCTWNYFLQLWDSNSLQHLQVMVAMHARSLSCVKTGTKSSVFTLAASSLLPLTGRHMRA